MFFSCCSIVDSRCRSVVFWKVSCLFFVVWNSHFRPSPPPRPVRFLPPRSRSTFAPGQDDLRSGGRAVGEPERLGRGGEESQVQVLLSAGQSASQSCVQGPTIAAQEIGGHRQMRREVLSGRIERSEVWRRKG